MGLAPEVQPPLSRTKHGWQFVLVFGSHTAATSGVMLITCVGEWDGGCVRQTLVHD